MSLRRWLAVLGVCLIVGVGGYYLFGSSSKNEDAAGAQTFNFSTNSWVGFGPMYLAKEMGYFDGVNVVISMTDDQGQRVAAMTNGNIDGYGDTVDLLVSTRANNVPAVSVMQADISNGADGIIVNSSINSIKDLKGKKIAVQKNFVGESFLTYVLKKNNMTMSDVEAIDMESGAAGAAFVSGSVDAAVTFEPWLSKATERNGGKILVTSKDEPGVVVDTVSINENYLKSNSKTVKKVVSGWYKAVEYWNSNPTEANAIMSKSYNLSPAEFADYISGLEWPTIQQSLDYFQTSDGKQGKIFEVSDIFGTAFLENGSITAKPDISKAIDSSIMKSLIK